MQALPWRGNSAGRGLRCLLVLLADVAMGLVYWSELKNTTEDPCTGQHCVIPSGQFWVLDASMEVETLTVKGVLKWDTGFKDLEIRTGYLLVSDGGHFKVGTCDDPMTMSAKIHITKRSPETHAHQGVGYRFLASFGKDSRIDMHGRKFERTWTMLDRTAALGSKEIFIRDDPLVMGWKVGDRIGIATTSRGNSSTYTIAEIGTASEWQLPLKSVAGIKARRRGSPLSATQVAGKNTARWGQWCKGLCISSSRYLVVEMQAPSNISRLRLNFSETLYAPSYRVEVLADGEEAWEAGTVVANAGGGSQEVILSHLDRTVSAFRFAVDSLDLDGRASGEPATKGVWLQEIEVFGSEVDGPKPSVLHLEEPLQHKYLGGPRMIHGKSFYMAAEVVNLERSIVITGDSDTFQETQQGIHTGMFGEGAMDIRYARIENCGQHNTGGRYCMHFHGGGHCPNCVFQGNAIVDSSQVGIAIENTHETTVDNNIIWDAKGAGIYIKDGNEMSNTISSNVMICSVPGKCTVEWLRKKGTAGIYMVGMTNDIIGNHVAGYENGIWAAGSLHPDGQGRAEQKVCPQHTPFGVFRHNVNHDCQRYGLRLDRQYPRNVQRDSNGYVQDMGSCSEFTMEGADNGVKPANTIEDGLDWHNMFVGAFGLGDVSFVRFSSVNNANSLIWKESKNFADNSSRHIRDSVFANDKTDRYGRLQVQGPAGSFAFLVDGVDFVGGPTDLAALTAGFHCGRAGAGGPCAVQYYLHATDFSKLDPSCKRIQFGAYSLDAGRTMPMFVSDDNSLGGYRSLVSGHLAGFAADPGCQALGYHWDGALGCNADVRRFSVRIKDEPEDSTLEQIEEDPYVDRVIAADNELQVKPVVEAGMNLGPLQVEGPGYEAVANMSTPVLGANAGIMLFENNDNTTSRGYSIPVLVGRNYSVHGQWRGHVVFEFSDPVLPQLFGQKETLHISYAGQECDLFPQAKRAAMMFSAEMCELRASEVDDGSR